MSNISNQKREHISFRGKPLRKTHQKDNFTIYTVNVNHSTYPDVWQSPIYHNVTIMGFDLPELIYDVNYDITATEEYNPDKKTYSYKVCNIEETIPKSKHEVCDFLSRVITTKQANIIMNAYPNIIDLVLTNKEDTIDISSLKNIGDLRLDKIINKIRESFGNYGYYKIFAGVLSDNVIKKIGEKYRSTSKMMEALKEDPYKFFQSIDRIGYKTADAILLKLEDKKILSFDYDLMTSVYRCAAAMVTILHENQDDGNTKMKVALMYSKLEKYAPEAAGRFVEAVNDERFYVTEDKQYISFTKTKEIEEYIVNEIKSWVNAKPTPCDIDVEIHRNQGEYDLSDEQMNFLRMATKENVCILTAPAGTGKSAVTGVLTNILAENDISFCLLTPTGRSAKVLSSYTGYVASTIHRKLKYDGTKFNTDIITEKYIIIDEFSMCDIYLFKEVLKRINTSFQKLIIVGDNEQLPSVSAGNLLHDFINSGVIPIARLSKVFRYGSSGLLTVATDIRLGSDYLSKVEDDKVTTIGDEKDYIFVRTADNDILDTAIKLYMKLLHEGYNGQNYSVEDIAILSAYNVGPMGTKRINDIIQERLHRNNGKYFQAGNGADYIRIYKGDMVMQTVNNYKMKTIDGDETSIMNGETGMVTNIIKDGFIVDFNGEEVVCNKKTCRDLQLAYSYSIHRSQGGSIKAPIILTPKGHIYFLNANFLYVGVTRSTNVCFHIGLPSTVSAILKKKENYSRLTNMQDMFKKIMDNS